MTPVPAEADANLKNAAAPGNNENPRQMVPDILSERKPLFAVMCLKVSRLLGSTPEFWMCLQAEYDLKKAVQNTKVMECGAQIVPVKPLVEVHA
jgi:addiction module HigA family antidote